MTSTSASARSAKVGLHAVERGLAKPVEKLRLALPGRTDEFRDADPLGVETMSQVVNALAELLLDELGGDLLGHQLDECVHRALVQREPCPRDMALAEARPQVGPQLVDRRELGGLGRPFVGRLGKDELFDLLDQYLEGNGFVLRSDG